ncbi:hypothetical protein OESDEN_03344 [Oesophagostomum dentatum]|uniref:Uncharacterized protein n=1 Tax=Oesophagostomum dentatum TaxID=61180 RepID=A0A0B1TKT8_OESDE|nr:hypothetical protein OESDEN_03344 [Oesophagostomum dentatum]
MRSILFVFLSLIPIALSLDCRKFSFAPACRGIMLKRSEASESEQPLELDQCCSIAVESKSGDSIMVASSSRGRRDQGLHTNFMAQAKVDHYLFVEHVTAVGGT